MLGVIERRISCDQRERGKEGLMCRNLEREKLESNWMREQTKARGETIFVRGQH